MGGWLARLKSEKTTDTCATETTKTPPREDKGVFVGFVAYPPAPFQRSGDDDPVAEATHPVAANDGKAVAPTPAPASDPDLWCWPASPAMNSGEIDLFLKRLERFTDKGLIVPVAEALADKLVQRDREGDDRRLCLECAHLQGFNHWRCGNWQAAEVARVGLVPDLVMNLQRCPGFRLTP